MGKKRKASIQNGGASKHSEASTQNLKLHINNFEDVADSEDEFLINRDKILLDEGPVAKRRRKQIEDEQLLQASDEEVLAYPTSDEDEVIESDDYESDGESKDKGSRRRAEDSDPDASQQPDEEDEEELGAWGDLKQDYYGGDTIDTEQAALEEEIEAKRLQEKQLRGMTDADFGFDEDAWADGGSVDDDDAEGHGVVTEVLPQLQITEDMDPEERLKLLKKLYPEFELIAKEFKALQGLYATSETSSRTAKEIVGLRAALDSQLGLEPVRAHVAILKHQALSAYLGTMAMYVAVLTSTANTDGTALAKPPLEMRDHPIMDSLVQCQLLWNKVKNLRVPDPAEELAAITKLTATKEEAPKIEAVKKIAPKTDGMLKQSKSKKLSKFTQEVKAQNVAKAAEVEAAARRAKRLGKLEEDLATLSNITSKTARTAQKPKQAPPRMIINEDDSDFGDETELTAHELAEKANRKKSLKFYTAQIAQKANKRGSAGRDAGGDADIPYRERLKERQARLNAEAEKRGKRAKQPGDDLGGESDEEDRRQARQIRGDEADEGDEYLDLITSHSKQKKERKQEAAAAYAKAAQEAGQVYEVETVGEDGKRKISYQIQANKGLTPHRKKDVRNPRVKKRKKFEEKKKKLGSIRAVYKGGEGKGGYKGELSGIKTNLVKGVKL